MLYKKVHLTKIHNRCLLTDREYAYSVDTFIIQKNHTANLYIELDSILDHVELAYFGKDALIKEAKLSSFNLINKLVDEKEKTFIHYDHLKQTLTEIYIYFQDRGVENYRLKETIINIYHSVLSSWHEEVRKIKRSCLRLKLFHGPEENETHREIDEITGLVKMFSSEC